jgi:cytochrome c peroxidase
MGYRLRLTWRRAGAAALVAAAVACGDSSLSPRPGEATRELLGLPDHFAIPAIPEYNPLTAEKIALGRRLFYDTRLSGNQSQSCASCHQQRLAFSDGVTTPHGSTGHVLLRNSQGLANAAYFSSLTWGNNVLLQLEDQILVPILSDNPVELGVLDGIRAEVLQRFDDDSVYRELFAAAFPEGAPGATINRISFALASFCRTLISGDSPYDRYYRGNHTALTDQQIRGLRLFNSERLECFHCHSGINFSTSYHDQHTSPGTITYPFFNNGLYNIGGDGGYPPGNQGIYELTHNPNDRGKFRPQGLRNVAVTAPYMHDGSIATLRDVIRHYARGGRLIDSGPYAGDGSLSPLKSGLVRGFAISEAEIDDVVAFLESLTDQRFLEDERFSDPFAGAKGTVGGTINDGAPPGEPARPARRTAP